MPESVNFWWRSNVHLHLGYRGQTKYAVTESQHFDMHQTPDSLLIKLKVWVNVKANDTYLVVGQVRCKGLFCKLYKFIKRNFLEWIINTSYKVGKTSGLVSNCTCGLGRKCMTWTQWQTSANHLTNKTWLQYSQYDTELVFFFRKHLLLLSMHSILMYAK